MLNWIAVKVTRILPPTPLWACPHEINKEKREGDVQEKMSRENTCVCVCVYRMYPLLMLSFVVEVVEFYGHVQ